MCACAFFCKKIMCSLAEDLGTVRGLTEDKTKKDGTLFQIKEDANSENQPIPFSLPGQFPTLDTDTSTGRRFIRYRNSWVISHNPKGEHETIVGDGTEGQLLAYFQHLSQSNENINFEVIDHLLDSGVDINATSPLGQCVMHKVAANWDETVAKYLFEKGSDIHLRDKRGRTPLHIAASTDHAEMITWLVTHGADMEVTTNIELQTPLHLAAKSDAVQALQTLVDKGGDYEVRDYKGRTPLHLAAELDRTAAAECLLSLPIPAEVRVQDNTGIHAIANMIQTMPKMALLALDQLHRIAPANRKQYYLINHLESEFGDKSAQGVKTPFEIAVEEKRRNILAHPVMQSLISEKWRFMRWYFYIHLAFYLIFLLSWTILIAHPSVQEKHAYAFPKDAWRLIVQFLAILTYIILIIEEIIEVITSRINHKNHIKLRIKLLRDDLDNLDPNLIEEREFMENVLAHLNKTVSNYFKDMWNVIDIFTYILIFVMIILHIADIIGHSLSLALWVARVSCFVVILIWVRLFKYARGFRSLGPLVVIISQLIGDIFHYFTLYAILFVPYVICFWVLFGGQQSISLQNAEDLSAIYRIAIMMFRMSLIDEYQYSVLRTIDEAMAAILVITFLFFLAVVGLNLFIALLSDTFQRVYDNAQANALLQQGRLILSYEDKAGSCFRQYYLRHIHKNCSPLTKFYDDDDDYSQQKPTELKKIMHKIHSIVSKLQLEYKSDSQRTTHGISVAVANPSTQNMTEVPEAVSTTVQPPPSSIPNVTTNQLATLKSNQNVVPPKPRFTVSPFQTRPTVNPKTQIRLKPIVAIPKPPYFQSHSHEENYCHSATKNTPTALAKSSPSNISGIQYHYSDMDITKHSDSSTISLSHRRMKKISTEDETWAKKLQPVKKINHRPIHDDSHTCS